MNINSVEDAKKLQEQNLEAIEILKKENEKISDYLREQLLVKNKIKLKDLEKKETHINNQISYDLLQLLRERDAELRNIRRVLLKEIKDYFNFREKMNQKLLDLNIKYVWQLVALNQSTFNKIFSYYNRTHLDYCLSEIGLFQGADVIKILFGDFDLEKDLKPQYTPKKDENFQLINRNNV